MSTRAEVGTRRGIHQLFGNTGDPSFLAARTHTPYISDSSSREPFKLKFLFQVHNVILSAGSLVLLLCIMEQM